MAKRKRVIKQKQTAKDFPFFTSPEEREEVLAWQQELGIDLSSPTQSREAKTVRSAENGQDSVVLTIDQIFDVVVTRSLNSNQSHADISNSKDKQERESFEVTFTFDTVVPKKEIVTFNFLLFLAALTCTRENREATLGDIAEKYEGYVEKSGPVRAKTIVAWDLGASLIPHFASMIGKGFKWGMKILGLKIVIKYFFG